MEVLDLQGACDFLKLAKPTLYKYIRTGQIPAFKVGGQWRILESRFQEWVEEEEHLTPKAG